MFFSHSAPSTRSQRKRKTGRGAVRTQVVKWQRLYAQRWITSCVGHVDWGCVAARRAAGSYTLTRAQARTRYWTPQGKPLKLEALLPERVGQTKELWVRVADKHRHLMRLLMIRVPEEV